MNKIDLGKRLKTFRQQRGLTMRALARKAKCSPSFLSQLELNRVSPTLVNLDKICVALDLSIVDMLREEPQLQEPIQVPLHTADHPLAMRWQRAWLHHLLPHDAPKPFTALQLTIEEGGSTPFRASRRSINELAIVLTGTVQLEAGGKIFNLEPSTAIYFDLSMDHQWRNTGTGNVEVLMVHPYVFRLFEQEEEDLIWSRRKDGVRLFR